MIVETFDGTKTGTYTADASSMPQLPDGTWRFESPGTAARMQADCQNSGLNSSGLAVLTPGNHTLTYSTESGDILAQGVYTVVGSGTASPAAPTQQPNPVTSGSITFSPSTVICSNAQEFVTTMSLPATVKSGANVTETIDGATYGSGVVSSDLWTAQTDGSWLSTTSASASSVATACTGGQSVMAVGTHHVVIVDEDGIVLAEGWYSVQP